MKFAVLVFAALLCLGGTARADDEEGIEDIGDQSPELSETNFDTHPLWNSVGDPESHLGSENYEEPEAALRQGNTLSEVNEIEE